MPKPNTRYQPMTLREIVGLFALPIKKPPDCPQVTQPGRQCQKGRVV